MKLSIVTTLFYSEPYIREFYSRILASIQKCNIDDYEIVFVNDGSPDKSSVEVQNIIKENHRVSYIELSRNFGHHQAILCGLEHSKGELVFLIDVDLEEPPELLFEFHQKLHAPEKVDVVIGCQHKRRGGPIEYLSGKLFYPFFRFISGLDLPDNMSTVRLMRRPYVDAVTSYKEKEINISGILTHVGFSHKIVTFDKLSTSTTTYSFRGKLSHLINATTSFSNKPLYLALGFLLTFIMASMLYLVYFVKNYFTNGTTPDGFTTIAGLILISSTVNFLILSIFGVYLAKIFGEVKNRPRFIVSKKE